MSILQPIPITPPGGVVKTESGRIAEGRFTDAPNMRFVRGTDGRSRPQKIGGWTRASTAVSSGVIRSTHAWRDLTGNQYYAAGSNQKLYVYDSNFVQNDITPYSSTGTLGANPFTTTNGSNVVTVSHTAHGRNPGDTAVYAGATATGGLTLNGAYVVATVVTANIYTILAASNATSGATGGGSSVTYSYEVPIGTDLAAYGTGAGVGPYGLGTWGTARSGNTIFIEPRIWSLDHFGQILIAAYNGGSIYTFDPTVSQPWPRAAVIATAPTDCRFAFVTAERYVIALRDNMVMSWSTQADYTVWTPATGNTANTRTLTEGSRLIAGKVLGPRISMVWSDSACYRMQWTGDVYVYSTDVVGRNCGLISPNAVATVAGAAFWMGPDNFWMYSGGGVQPMPNVEDIRRFVFDNLTSTNGFQCHATYVPKFNEIWFRYTVSGDVAISRYAVYSIPDQSWTVGPDTRTSGTNFPQGDTRPYIADADGYIYLHENGVDANGAALPCSLTLAPYAISEGLYSYDVQGFLLDLFDQIGDVTLTLNSWDRLSDAAVEDTETDTVSPPAEFQDVRLSGRYVGYTISSNVVGGYFRLGKPVAFVNQTGTRS